MAKTVVYKAKLDTTEFARNIAQALTEMRKLTGELKKATFKVHVDQASLQGFRRSIATVLKDYTSLSQGRQSLRVQLDPKSVSQLSRQMGGLSASIVKSFDKLAPAIKGAMADAVGHIKAAAPAAEVAGERVGVAVAKGMKRAAETYADDVVYGLKKRGATQTAEKYTADSMLKRDSKGRVMVDAKTGEHLLDQNVVREAKRAADEEIAATKEATKATKASTKAEREREAAEASYAAILRHAANMARKRNSGISGAESAESFPRDLVMKGDKVDKEAVNHLMNSYRSRIEANQQAAANTKRFTKEEEADLAARKSVARNYNKIIDDAGRGFRRERATADTFMSSQGRLNKDAAAQAIDALRLEAKAHVKNTRDANAAANSRERAEDAVRIALMKLAARINKTGGASSYSKQHGISESNLTAGNTADVSRFISQRKDGSYGKNTNLEALRSEVGERQKALNLQKSLSNESERALKINRGIGSSIADSAFKLAKWLIFFRLVRDAMMLIEAGVRKVFRAGLEYVRLMETQTLGLQATMAEHFTVTDTYTAKTLAGVEKLNALQGVSEVQWRRLQAASLAVVGQTSDLVMLYSSILPFASKLGKGLEDALEMTKATAIAASLMDVSFQDARSAIVSLMQGRYLSRNRLVTMLGFDKKTLQEMKGTPQLFTAIMDALGPFAAMADRAQNTLSALSETFNEFLGYIGKEFEAPFVKAFKTMVRSIQGMLFELRNGMNNEMTLRPEVLAIFLTIREAVKNAVEPLEAFGAELNNVGGKSINRVIFGISNFLRVLMQVAVWVAKVGMAITKFISENEFALFWGAAGLAIWGFINAITRLGVAFDVAVVKGGGFTAQLLSIVFSTKAAAASTQEASLIVDAYGNKIVAAGAKTSAAGKLIGSALASFAKGFGIMLVISAIVALTAKIMENVAAWDRAKKSKQAFESGNAFTGRALTEKKRNEGNYDDRVKQHTADVSDATRAFHKKLTDERGFGMSAQAVGDYREIARTAIATLKTIDVEEKKIEEASKARLQARRALADSSVRLSEAEIASLKKVADEQDTITQGATSSVLLYRERVDKAEQALSEGLALFSASKDDAERMWQELDYLKSNDDGDYSKMSASQAESAKKGRIEFYEKKQKTLQYTIDKSKQKVNEFRAAMDEVERYKLRANLDPSGASLTEGDEDGKKPERTTRSTVLEERIRERREQFERESELERRQAEMGIKSEEDALKAVSELRLVYFAEEMDLQRQRLEENVRWRDENFELFKGDQIEQTKILQDYENERAQIKRDMVTVSSDTSRDGYNQMREWYQKQLASEDLLAETREKYLKEYVRASEDAGEMAGALLDKQIREAERKLEGNALATDSQKDQMRQLVELFRQIRPYVVQLAKADRQIELVDSQMRALNTRLEVNSRLFENGAMSATDYYQSLYAGRQAELALNRQKQSALGSRRDTLKSMASNNGKLADMVELSTVESDLVQLKAREIELLGPALELRDVYQAWDDTLKHSLGFLSLFKEMSMIPNIFASATKGAESLAGTIKGLKSLGGSLKNLSDKGGGGIGGLFAAFAGMKSSKDTGAAYNPQDSVDGGVDGTGEAIGKAGAGMLSSLGGIAKSIPIFGAAIGAAIGIASAIFDAQVKKMKKTIENGIESLKIGMEDGTTTLGEGYAAMQRQRDEAVRKYGQSKAGRKALTELLPQFDDEIRALQQKIKDIRKSFEEQMASTMAGRGPFGDFWNDLMAFQVKAKEYMETFTSGTSEWVEAQQNVNQLFGRLLEDARQGWLSQMMDFEGEAISSQERVLDLMDEQLALSKQQVDLVKQRHSLTHDLIDTQEELNGVGEEREDLRQERIDAEKDLLDAQLKRAKDILNLEKQIRDIMVEAAEKESEIRRRGVLEAQLSVAEQKASEISKVRNDATEEVAKLRAELVGLKSDRDAEDGYGKRVKSLAKSEKDLSKKVHSLEDKLKDLQDQFGDIDDQSRKLQEQQALNDIKLRGAKEVAAIENDMFGLSMDRLSLEQRRQELDIARATEHVREWKQVRDLIDTIMQTSNGWTFNPPEGFPVIRIQVGDINIDNSVKNEATTNNNNNGNDVGPRGGYVPGRRGGKSGEEEYDEIERRTPRLVG